MVYQRIRNSHYAQYSRRMRNAGYSANFSIPLRSRASADFNMMDLVNTAGQRLSNTFNGSPNSGQPAVERAVEVVAEGADNLGDNAKRMRGRPAVEQAMDVVAEGVNGLRKASGGAIDKLRGMNPRLAVAGAAGAGALGLGGAYAANRMREQDQ